MQEYFESTNKENIQLNIKVRKIEPLIQGDAPKTRPLSRDKSQTKELKWQVLKPEDLQFGNLPIQKLLPVPFVNCIESFSRIEGCDNLIFIDFKMKKKWIDFLINRIQHSDKNHDNLIYNIYTSTNSFRFLFSDQSLNANIVCGKEYLSNHREETNAVVPQKEIKKGLLKFIFKKWSN
jgi:hypothetical protein